MRTVIPKAELRSPVVEKKASTAARSLFHPDALDRSCCVVVILLSKPTIAAK